MGSLRKSRSEQLHSAQSATLKIDIRVLEAEEPVSRPILSAYIDIFYCGEVVRGMRSTNITARIGALLEYSLKACVLPLLETLARASQVVKRLCFSLGSHFGVLSTALSVQEEH